MRLALPADLLLFVVTGCNFVVTTTIRNGRAAYNDAIAATNNEQILGMRDQGGSIASRLADAQPLAASMVTTFRAVPNSLRRELADVDAGREVKVKLDLEIPLPDWFEAWMAELT